jgi:hypothetical protein
MVRDQPGEIVCETLSSKITAAKWTGGITEVVEHLPYECKSLSSNPNPTQKKVFFHYAILYMYIM